MINPLFKKETETEIPGFNFSDIIILTCFIKGISLGYKNFKGKVIGKVKNSNAYVINLFSLDLYYPAEVYDERRNYILALKKKYGYPIRQLELEWGGFCGSISEFIVPEHELKKVDI